MPQNYDILATFEASNGIPTKILTISQKHVEDPMTKLVGAVNAIFARTVITVDVIGVNEEGEIIRDTKNLRITDVPYWQYLPEKDVLIAPFRTDAGIHGLAVIKESS